MTRLVLSAADRIDVQADLDRARADRTRIIAARDGNRHLDHWKTPRQLAAIDRHIRRITLLLGADA